MHGAMWPYVLSFTQRAGTLLSVSRMHRRSRLGNRSERPNDSRGDVSRQSVPPGQNSKELGLKRTTKETSPNKKARRVGFSPATIQEARRSNNPAQTEPSLPDRRTRSE